MIQRLTLTKITRYTTNKDGAPLFAKAGKPYVSLRIQTAEHGQKWLSGFGDKWNEGWKEGDEVSVDVVQKGDFLNFSKVNTEAILTDKVAGLEDQVKKITDALRPLVLEWKARQPMAAPVVSGTNIPYPQMTKAPNFAPNQADSEDINPEDIPL